MTEFFFLFYRTLTHCGQRTIGIADWQCEKIVFTTHTRLFSFCTRFFLVLFRILTDAKQYGQGFSNPINHIRGGCVFSREETEIKGGFAQNTGSRWYNIYVHTCMYVHFNPALLLPPTTIMLSSLHY